jgi:outer membrane protein assembly factor BamB
MVVSSVVLGCGPRIELPDGAASGDAGGVEEPYRGLLRVAGSTLLHIDPEDARVTEVCELEGIGDDGTQSLAFTRDGRLFATYDSAFLYEIDPCACEASEVGPYGFDGLAGILPDRGDGLWGIASEEDQFVAIDPETGAGTAVGPLRRDLTNQGATWSERDQTLYVLVGSGPAELHTLDPATGSLSFHVRVGTFFSAVGFEYHPETGRLYACTADDLLLAVDPDTGELTTIGATGWPGCDNLAAPAVPTPRGCLP